MSTVRVTSGPRTDSAIQWLLDGDPAIRWQTLRDLAGAAESTVARERRKVAREGWGALLLARQDPQGTWAGGLSADGGLYLPKWISTTYTMLLLRDFGLLPGSRPARKACKLLLDGGLRRDGGVSYGTWAKWTGRGETCVSGMVLSVLSYFEYEDPRLATLASHLLEEQMPDGGWNCQRPRGATHASVHTTISVLEGLRHFELHRGNKVRAVRAAQRRGREFLLSSAHSITSKQSTHRATCAWPRPSISSAAAGAQTGAGPCKTPTKGKPISKWNVSASRAAGILCARCGCCGGGMGGDYRAVGQDGILRADCQSAQTCKARICTPRGTLFSCPPSTPVACRTITPSTGRFSSHGDCTAAFLQTAASLRQ